MNPTPAVVGWDIGGVNTKVARLPADGDGSRLRSMCLPYEIKGAPGALVATLKDAARSIGSRARRPARGHHDRRIIAGVPHQARGRPLCPRRAWSRRSAAPPSTSTAVDGRFITPAEARKLPLSVAAANWAATAHTCRPNDSDLCAPRHRHHVHRPHPYRRWTGCGRGPHRPGPAAQRRTGLYRRRANAGGGGCPGSAAVGWKRRRRRPTDSR